MTSTLRTHSSTSADEIHTEAVIVQRTVEHIAFDLDYFSRTIRQKQHNPTVISDIERHLGQARRNCADAMAISERILRAHDAAKDLPDAALHDDAERIRDAFSLLALADAAYLRAFEVAVDR